MLAANPPTEVYREIMKWDAQQRNDQNYVDVWQQWRNAGFTDEAATYFVGAICDLTAMSMMMVGAGTNRIEAMKASLRNLQANQSGRVIGDDNSVDHVHFFRQAGQANAFETLLTNWCARDGSGVVQLKFIANRDWHTFCIERIHEANQDPAFLIYQSYQNAYRLQDFLGLGTQVAQTDHMRRVWSAFDGGDKAIYQRNEQTFINASLARISNAANYLGCGAKFDTATLRQRVITPLRQMLAGQLPNATYVQMTGSPLRNNAYTPFMAVLMCDTIDSNTFKQNYADLRKATGLTMYPVCN
jgi:hypothetical protein